MQIKDAFSEVQISIEVNDELVSDKKIFTKIFNEHYIDIVEKSSGTKPSSLGNSANPLLDRTMVGKVIDTYQDHPSVMAIKSSVTPRTFKIERITIFIFSFCIGLVTQLNGPALGVLKHYYITKRIRGLLIGNSRFLIYNLLNQLLYYMV